MKKLIIAVVLILSACATGQYNNPQAEKPNTKIKWKSPMRYDGMICVHYEKDYSLWCWFPATPA